MTRPRAKADRDALEDQVHSVFNRVGRLETALREATRTLNTVGGCRYVAECPMCPDRIKGSLARIEALSAGEVPGSTGASRVMRDVCSCGAQFDSTCTCQPGSTGDPE